MEKIIMLKLLILVLVHLIAANPHDDFEHPFGHPKNIITFDEQQLDNSTVMVNYEVLDDILLHPDVKDRQIVVVSIVGAFRKGKSFFLNYCLRFLYANFKSVASRTQPSGNISEWMGDGDEPLRGFSWKGGSTRDTTGLIFWSDVFLYDDDFKNKIAIVVMDTQGLFDKETPPADNTKIFALGTLISSIQFYNLNGVVQEDQLQYLQLATDFARLAATNNADKDTKAFQNIVFLMRDWDYVDEYPAGVQGGAGYLRELLQIKDNQHPSLRSVREYVHQSFNKISCYLLPDPGKTVRTNPSSYKGEWSNMDEDFTNALNETIIDVLKPSELIPKKINGNVLKASESIERSAQEAAAAVTKANKRIQQLEAHNLNTDKAVAEKEQIIQQYNNNQTEFVNKLKEIQKEVELSGKLLEVQRRKQSTNIRWHTYNSSRVLTNMMVGGYKKQICRIKYDNGEVYNGEFPADKHACYITMNNKQHKYEEFTVLGYFKGVWNKVEDQIVPSCAIEGGRLSSGVIMYICRAKTSDGFLIGSLINGECKTPYPEIETYITYQILCV
ncbi:unnamed protein product [Diamesa serratosioi]